MSDIYLYKNEFEKSRVIEKINSISDLIREEENKPMDKRDNDLIKRLVYEQFVQGLKLSPRNNIF